MKQKIRFFAILTVIIFLAACNQTKNESSETTHEHKTEKGEKASPKKDCKDVHWSHHKGEHGPENWKNLCQGFTACGGKSQSPIDINTEGVVVGNDLTALDFDYGQSTVDIINNGHTVQFNVDGDHTAKLNNKDYELLQFHYHALSEHTVNDEYFPIEAHFVHKHSDSDLAVLGIMIVAGEENAFLKKYLGNFPKNKGKYIDEEDMFELIELIPENRSYYYYNGSLTTPPCSEVVTWYVLINPIEASKEQIKEFSEILKENYRPTMPLNGRTVQVFKE